MNTYNLSLYELDSIFISNKQKDKNCCETAHIITKKIMYIYYIRTMNLASRL